MKTVNGYQLSLYELRFLNPSGREFSSVSMHVTRNNERLTLMEVWENPISHNLLSCTPVLIEGDAVIVLRCTSDTLENISNKLYFVCADYSGRVTYTTDIKGAMKFNEATLVDAYIEGLQNLGVKGYKEIL